MISMLVSYYYQIKKGPGISGTFRKIFYSFNNTLLYDPVFRTKIKIKVKIGIVNCRNHFSVNLETKIEIYFKIERLFAF